MPLHNDIGNALLQARMEHHLTIAEVSVALHLRKHYIEALEQGNFEALPQFPYVRAYLVRYAAYLSLDVAEISRRFDEMEARAGRDSLFLPHSFSHEKQATLYVALFSGIAALCVLLFWAVWIRPDAAAPSLVETMPEPRIVATSLPDVLRHSPCLASDVRAYPPCYWPVPKAEQSVMFHLR